MWRFIVWMLRVDPWRTVLCVAAMSLAGLIPAAMVWTTRYAFGDAIGLVRGTVRLQALLVWIGVWAALRLVDAALWPLVELVFERLRQEMEDALQRNLQHKAGVLRLEVFERPDLYDILRRAREAAAPGFFLNVMLAVFSIPTAVATLVAVSAIVAHWDILLLAAVLVAAAPEPLTQIVQSRSAFFLERSQTARERLRNYLGTMLTSRDAAKEVRTYAMGPWILERWSRLYWSVADERFRQTRAQGLTRAGLSSIGSLGVAAGLAIAARDLVVGTLRAGQFAAMLGALQGVQAAVVSLMHVFGQYFGDQMLQLADLFIYLDLGPEEVRPAGGPSTGVPPTLGEIAVEAVTFRYPLRAAAALVDVSFRMRPGERIALVGENGSGKTTLVKVLTGLYQPTSGRVLYGGGDLRDLDLPALRGLQSAVFQDHIHYAFTLAENVGYGRADHVDDREAVERAAAAGGADEVARVLPRGFETPLTREFTGGTELSGGQWQRVAVSRGFMREAALVVLDEPTAALDPLAEADVFHRFVRLAAGPTADTEGVADATAPPPPPPTALLVSHRLGFARLCDRVLVLDAGRLIEDGSHDELVAAGGAYARLWATQAQWYR